MKRHKCFGCDRDDTELRWYFIPLVGTKIRVCFQCFFLCYPPETETFRDQRLAQGAK